jgi:hypothetical protein
MEIYPTHASPDVTYPRPIPLRPVKARQFSGGCGGNERGCVWMKSPSPYGESREASRRARLRARPTNRGLVLSERFSAWEAFGEGIAVIKSVQTEKLGEAAGGSALG